MPLLVATIDETHNILRSLKSAFSRRLMYDGFLSPLHETRGTPP